MQDSKQWAAYPAGLSSVDEIEIDVDSLRGSLEDLQGIIFSDDDINVRVTDVVNDAPIFNTYTDPENLWARIEGPLGENARVRIISIFSARTYTPLQITSTLMRRILHKYEVDPNFIRVVSSFGEQPHLSEACSNFFSLRTTTTAETRISYKMNYVEMNQRGGNDPWSFRHTGVYHDHRRDFDLFILLHPNMSNALENRISTMVGIGQNNDEQRLKISKFCAEPYRLHLLAMSSFFDNWRFYLRCLGDRFARENNLAMVLKPDAVDAKTSFAMVQNLRNVNDFTRFAKACCASNLDLVRGLSESTVWPLQGAGGLTSQIATLRGYIESSEALIPRMQNALDLAGYTLALHNQLETAKVDRELRDMTGELRDVTGKLRDLTECTVDDSATVKIVTVVSAVYLPGSFVATLYGMNFFRFDEVLKRIRVSDDFWIFVATWLPLTFITSIAYLFVAWRRKVKKRRKHVPGVNVREKSYRFA